MHIRRGFHVTEDPTTFYPGRSKFAQDLRYLALAAGLKITLIDATGDVSFSLPDEHPWVAEALVAETTAESALYSALAAARAVIFADRTAKAEATIAAAISVCAVWCALTLAIDAFTAVATPA